MELILQLRSIATPFLDSLMFYITQLGSTKFYLIAVPVIYWCINRKSGYYIGMSVLAGGVATDIAKGMVNALRPFQVDSTISVSADFLESAIGSGMPSGHAFNSMAFWTAASARFKRAWLWTLSAALILIIGFTRVYAGVHFPLQVLWGWLGGALTSVTVLLLLSLAEKRLKGGLATLALLISGASLLAYALVPELSKGGEDYIGLIGIIGGMSLGYRIHLRSIRTEAEGPFVSQLIKLAIGFAAFLALKEGADMATSAYPGLLMPLYFLLGLWPTAGATAIFKALRLERKVSS